MVEKLVGKWCGKIAQKIMLKNCVENVKNSEENGFKSCAEKLCGENVQ